MKNEVVDQVWDRIENKVFNFIKVYILKEHANELLVAFNSRIEMLVKRYSAHLPRHVAEGEIDDLRTVSRLELIEAIKAWSYEKSKDIWPLAQIRITGAMKDHIRHITRTDPSRIYEWVTNAAYMYMAISKENEFASKIETGMQLNQAMKVLTTRDRDIVISYTKKDLTFKEIGEQHGISESQVSRIYNKSLKVLKLEMNKADR
ncbi:MAG: sigma-70 family RNA polymerase sigma factor [bacterium]|nr:sigma-70 family RNA polymerase sigma factor [bacterium]